MLTAFILIAQVPPLPLQFMIRGYYCALQTEEGKLRQGRCSTKEPPLKDEAIWCDFTQVMEEPANNVPDRCRSRHIKILVTGDSS